MDIAQQVATGITKPPAGVGDMLARGTVPRITDDTIHVSHDMHSRVCSFQNPRLSDHLVVLATTASCEVSPILAIQRKPVRPMESAGTSRLFKGDQRVPGKTRTLR